MEAGPTQINPNKFPQFRNRARTFGTGLLFSSGEPPSHKAMIGAWKKQFSLKQLSLQHDKPITFVVSQWQKEQEPSIIYLVYRWVVVLIFFITFVISIQDLKHPEFSAGERAKWLIYLTNWGYTACTFQALVSGLLLSASMTSFRDPALRFYKVYWAANETATVIAFGITVLYWSIIYDETKMAFDAMNFFVHGNNSILMMLDLFVVAHPVRLLHCCYPVVFGLCYAIFSVVYYAAGGTSKSGDAFIYTILDWRNPGKTILVCLAVLAFIIVIHVFCWGLYKLRIRIHSYYAAKEKNAEMNDQQPPAPMVTYVNEAMVPDVV